MIIKNDYIRNDNLQVHLTDSLYHVYELFDEYRVSHLPVVSEKGKFLGLLSEKDAFDIYDSQKNVKENNIPFEKNFLNDTSSIFQAISLISEHKMTLLPIICDKEMYRGFILPIDVVSQLGKDSSFSSRGGLITLKVQDHDYSLNEISRIIESENALITTLYIEDIPNEQSMFIHLKINAEDLSRIIKSLERFKYDIYFTHNKSDFDDEAEFRFNSFLKFLNP